ncbi:hypothetical protein A2U01_0114047, partial [Trifolium medium]|nr:hypothetical protein [Trifolium medium]
SKFPSNDGVDLPIVGFGLPKLQSPAFSIPHVP